MAVLPQTSVLATVVVDAAVVMTTVYAALGTVLATATVAHENLVELLRTSETDPSFLGGAVVVVAALPYSAVLLGGA